MLKRYNQYGITSICSGAGDYRASGHAFAGRDFDDRPRRCRDRSSERPVTAAAGDAPPAPIPGAGSSGTCAGRPALRRWRRPSLLDERGRRRQPAFDVARARPTRTGSPKSRCVRGRRSLLRARRAWSGKPSCRPTSASAADETRVARSAMGSPSVASESADEALHPRQIHNRVAEIRDARSRARSLPDARG